MYEETKYSWLHLKRSSVQIAAMLWAMLGVGAAVLAQVARIGRSDAALRWKELIFSNIFYYKKYFLQQEKKKHYRFFKFMKLLFSTGKFNHISTTLIWKPLNKRMSKCIYSKCDPNKISWHIISETRKLRLSGWTIHRPRHF